METNINKYIICIMVWDISNKQESPQAETNGFSGDVFFPVLVILLIFYMLK